MMRRKREHEERERQKRIQEQRLVDEQRRAALEADQMANRCRAFQAEEQQRQEEAERQRVREERSVYSNAMLVVFYIFLPMPRHQKLSSYSMSRWPAYCLHTVTGYLHLTRVKSTNSKKYSKGKIQR